MRKLIMLAILIACAAPLTFAQTTSTSDYPSVEFFAGYSHGRIDNSENSGLTADDIIGIPGTFTSTSDFLNEDSVGFHGFETSIVGNLNRYVGLKGDLSGHFKSEEATATFTPVGGPAITQNFNVKARLWNVLGGIEVKGRNESAVTPWVHGLAGIAHGTIDFSATNTPFGNLSESTSDTGFAAAFGGGLDIRAGNRVSVRASGDYNPSWLGDNSTFGTGNSSRQDNFRFSIGLLFH